MDENLRTYIELLKILRDRVRGVALNMLNGAYIHGRPGSAKTYTVFEMLYKLNVPYVACTAHLTAIGLFEILEKHPTP